MILAAGELFHRVTFATRAMVDDGAGNIVSGDWEDQFTEPAKISSMRGREEVLAERLQGIRPAEIIVRRSHRTERIEPEWRAVNARKPDEVYAIHDIRDPDNGRRWLILTCTLGGPA